MNPKIKADKNAYLDTMGARIATLNRRFHSTPDHEAQIAILWDIQGMYHATNDTLYRRFGSPYYAGAAPAYDRNFLEGLADAMLTGKADQDARRTTSH